MCVIYACGSKLPPEDELDRGHRQNDDGAGVAWLKGGNVHWEKGLADDEAVKRLIKDQGIGFPLAIHFRTASVGGVSPELTHPFPVTDDVPLWLAGEAPEVLFHNGHLTKWDDWILPLAFAQPGLFPDGPWSDSRALAWATHLKGTGIVKFIRETSRVLTFKADAYWEGEDGWQNFSFWGSWEGDKKDGFLQSSATQGRVYKTCPTHILARAEEGEEENVWSLEELETVLSGMEKELKDARITTRV